MIPSSKPLRVLSVELGNTTTKCILVETDLDDGTSRIAARHVDRTRSIAAKDGFARTVWGYAITEAGVKDIVRRSINTTLLQSRLSARDLDFVVRSTGVTAGFSSPEDVGTLIKALADACLAAGVEPRQMIAPLAADNLAPRLRAHSIIDRSTFTGSVAGTLPPGEPVAANEMEGELVTAGLKDHARASGCPFRNPYLALDFGTTLAGRLIDDERRTVATFAGLAGGILDAVAQGCGFTSAMDVPVRPGRTDRHSEGIMELVEIGPVRTGDRVGTVPVDPVAASRAGVTVIGCSADLDAITSASRDVAPGHLSCVLDGLAVGLFDRLLASVEEAGLDVPDSVGITGRGATTGAKPELLRERVPAITIVDDGLARGAAVMAMCMLRLCRPHGRMGGCPLA
ncbi:MAG: methanogenesis marker 14 protein [Candidatus Undinarchaeales archaeon]|jgi:putative methanogenesis marker protein 14|nr:methanogenesis marker 14 protein [Candidatus Undinarchaeales archaeon]MDP7494579.1 methanogenesis marker 14 protein [Candidatus Undinarchaeales archaeon]